MAKKNDLFDRFLDKNFGEDPLHIEKPRGGERSTTVEQREQFAKKAAEEVKGAEAKDGLSNAGETSSRAPGRPKNEGRGPVKNMNFLLEEKLRYDLELLKVRQHRTSLTELLNEAIVDLLKKYGVEGY